MYHSRQDHEVNSKVYKDSLEQYYEQQSKGREKVAQSLPQIKPKLSEEQRNSPEELGLKKNLLNFYGANDDQKAK
jgi:hypothetical protein